jgi:hypothetical protein
MNVALKEQRHRSTNRLGKGKPCEKQGRNILQPAMCPDSELIRQAMVELARRRYRLPNENGECRHLKRIVVILSASRGGSSLLYDTLAQSEYLSSLDGEIEPYYILTGNCFPHNASDALNELRNPGEFRRFIDDELNTADYSERWRKRLLLQFPDLDLDTSELRSPADVDGFLERHGLAGYYDGAAVRTPYRRCWKIEEPAFVRAKPAQPLTDTLLLKSPSDSYRLGVYERLFPHAEVCYIHLTRNAASACNGLMDGWNSASAFHSHYIHKRWWKFDLPPGWADCVDAPLEDRCVLQWCSAHQHILASDRRALRVKFETLLEEPDKTVASICRWLGMPSHHFELHTVMATAPPRPYRWRQRADVIGPVMRRARVQRMMRVLGYSMNEGDWR